MLGPLALHDIALSPTDREVATLHYDAPAACPDAEAFKRRVALRLGYDPFVPRAARAVEVRLRERAGLVTLRARIGTAERSYEEQTARCDTLVETGAAAVAMAIDPVHASMPLQQVPAPAPTPAAQAPTTPPDDTKSSKVAEPALAPSDPLRFFAYADATLGFGVLPATSLGAQAGLGGAWKSASLSVEGRVDSMPSAARTAQGDTIDATALALALVPCGHLEGVAICGVARAGSMQGTAPNVATPTLGNTLYGSLALRAAALVPLSDTLSCRLSGELGVPLVRTSFVLDGRAAWTAPSVLGGLSAGLQMKF